MKCTLDGEWFQAEFRLMSGIPKMPQSTGSFEDSNADKIGSYAILSPNRFRNSRKSRNLNCSLSARFCFYCFRLCSSGFRSNWKFSDSQGHKNSYHKGESNRKFTVDTLREKFRTFFKGLLLKQGARRN